MEEALAATVFMRKASLMQPPTKRMNTVERRRRPFLISWLIIWPRPGITNAEHKEERMAFFILKYAHPAYLGMAARIAMMIEWLTSIELIKRRGCCQ
jgi:hypothetical protein